MIWSVPADPRFTTCRARPFRSLVGSPCDRAKFKPGKSIPDYFLLRRAHIGWTPRMPLGEVISVFAGQCGTQVSQAVWELMAVEHGVGPDGMLIDPSAETDYDKQSGNVFFMVDNKDRYVPRTTIVDTEPTVIDEVRCGLYRTMFNPRGLISGLEDMANNFGRGYYGVPQTLIDATINSIRKEVEHTDLLQAILFCHAYGGGTGGGTACRIAELMDTEFMKIPKIEIAVFPDHQKSCCVVEPYNAILCCSTLDDISTFSVLCENEALTDICTKKLGIERPAFSHLNRVIAQATSGFTATLRHEGPVTASLLQLQTNLVPFPRLRYLQLGIAPLCTADVMSHEAFTVPELTLKCFEKENQMNTCDPKNSVMMACALLYRGDVPIKEITDSIEIFKKRSIVGLVDWCPTGFKVGVVERPPAVVKQSGLGKTCRQLTAVYNSTLVIEPFKCILHRFSTLLAKKAFVHWFLQEGMEEAEFCECADDVQAIMNDYIFIENCFNTGAECAEPPTVDRRFNNPCRGEE
nr:tubulin alpha chain [Echinococcus granulosus]